MNNSPVRASGTKLRILFVCAGNTCRSAMAEFITRQKFGHLTESSSAGFSPGSQADAENAIYTLKKLFGVDASGHIPRRIARADVDGVDLVVTMDPSIARQFRREFPAFPAAQFVAWNIQDPYGDDLEEYERCASKVFREIKGLLADRGHA